MIMTSIDTYTSKYAIPAEAERAGLEDNLKFADEKKAAFINRVHALAAEKGYRHPQARQVTR
jgi:hypothetical protein